MSFKLPSSTPPIILYREKTGAVKAIMKTLTLPLPIAGVIMLYVRAKPP
jgi:hypothetical protein